MAVTSALDRMPSLFFNRCFETVMILVGPGFALLTIEGDQCFAGIDLAGSILEVWLEIGTAITR